jgi:hypothetical protein
LRALEILWLAIGWHRSGLLLLSDISYSHIFFPSWMTRV